ncbi:unnamed protein product, partial [Prorocentrum cordatum]
AEKPTIAGTIAHSLSGAQKPRRRKGQHPRSPVYEFDGFFRGEPASFRVTATFGHVYPAAPARATTTGTPRARTTCSSPPSSRARTGARGGAARSRSTWRRRAKGCQALVLWLDCDREGENICFEVIQCAGTSLDQNRSWDHAYNGRIFRAKFSSLRQQDLMYALHHLIRPNEAMSLSVDARQEIDLRLGVAFSRYQTQYFRENFGMLSNFLKAVTYGPCQMPTLWFCVQRQCQIENFSPKNSWRLEAKLKIGDGIPEITAENTSGKVWDKNEAQILLRKVCAEDAAKVTAVEKRRNDLQRPLPLNTVVLLQKASELCGLSPGEAMMQAEQLYLKGFLSYPRTETTRYPQHFDKWGVLEQLKVPDAPFSGLAHKVAELKIDGRTDGVDVGDHPPITPVKHATERQCKDPRACRVGAVQARLPALPRDGVPRLHGQRGRGGEARPRGRPHGREEQAPGAGYLQLDARDGHGGERRRAERPGEHQAWDEARGVGHRPEAVCVYRA